MTATKRRPGWWMSIGAAATLGCLFAGCAGSAHSQGGGYYLDDGPGRPDPRRVARLMAEPDPVPKQEPLLARTNRPYRVMGQDFKPMTERKPYRQQGVASWYGQRFHGKPTSTGEIYDMYRMTAAHPTLPLPSYARVTRLDTGRSVVVRVNDRGPFLRGRLIDLSYLAASKLGYVGQGHARVEVELLDPATGMGMTPGMTVASAGAAASAGTATRGAVRSATARGSSAAAAPAGAAAGMAAGARQSVDHDAADPSRAVNGMVDANARAVHDRTLPPGSLARAEVDLPGDEGEGAVAVSEDAQAPVASSVNVASTGDAPVGGASAGVASAVAASAAVASTAAASQAPESAVAHGRSGVAEMASGASAAHGDSGWFLQLGVFRQLDNALRVQREQMARSTPADPPVELVQRGEQYRVLLGPYAEEAMARAVAADIGERTGHRPGVLWQ